MSDARAVGRFFLAVVPISVVAVITFRMGEYAYTVVVYGSAIYYAVKPARPPKR